MCYDGALLFVWLFVFVFVVDFFFCIKLLFPVLIPACFGLLVFVLFLKFSTAVFHWPLIMTLQT